ncbi:MAG: LVIVD repeat-containing protein, partial [bacterium]
MATLKRITIGIVIMALAGLCASGFQGQKPPDDYRRFQEIQPLDEPFSGFDSLNVRFIGNWPFGASYAVAYDASRSLVFCGSGGGVYILDVSNPANPVKVSEAINTRGIVNGLFYASSTHRLYIADGQGGFEIWDVSNPSSPYKLGYYFTPGRAYGVYVSGVYAYVADGDAGLRIINVSNPSNPYQVGYYDTPGFAWGVYVSGSYAYVADDWYGLRIIDVLNPSSPYEVGYYDTPDYAEDVYVLGSYAYVADGSAGLRIINVSNPASPIQVG